jgi:hypothetical protein
MVLSAPRYQSINALNMQAGAYSGKPGRCNPLIVMCGCFTLLTPETSIPNAGNVLMN